MTQHAEPPRIVDDLMTDDLVAIETTNTIGQARDLLLTLGISALPVLDSGKLTGVVTSSDLADNWPDDVPVTAAMSKAIHRIHPRATLQAAADQMLSLHVHHLIVEDRDRIGMITSFDLLRALTVGTSDAP